ncbi:hypothetical protein [Marinobacterium arenosum]|uniref:hypothetical protein n=1 Tax=Marinobacterium arenosum TaxID=2862496 RepID=UPI001C951A85|nr:hypothetical protein [Marinobacterium arenosum]MBY4678536.1 hypothetical protein [Marinobacterium arenosum]
MTQPSDNPADRACQLTRDFIGQALKVRQENPEYAQTPAQTALILGLELGRLAAGLDDAGRAAMLAGLQKGLVSLKLSDDERQAVLAAVQPQIQPGSQA